MCVTCGCGSGEQGARIEGDAAGGWHTHADGTRHRHGHGDVPAHDPLHDHSRDPANAPDGGARHSHPHDHGHPGLHDHGHAHRPHDRAAATASRLVRIERDILADNDTVARRNRAWLAKRGIFALNLVSSPGSGKTTLLCRTVRELAGRLPLAVIEGDQQTSFDADRIRATGAPALQINTGKGCHLDASMVETALPRLAPADDSVLMIENVGNLVCPAAFDLGEAHKVVVLSVTEGEDKPLKYPDMFAAASLMLLNKADLLPHLEFDVARCLAYALQVNPGIRIIELSATAGGAGFDAWLAWVVQGVAQARERRLQDSAVVLGQAPRPVPAPARVG